MTVATQLLKKIDEAIVAEQESSFRVHLGASIIGKACARYIWYSFRWALEAEHEARLLRIFDRGKREEAAIVARLRAAGVTVWETDANGKQFRISRHGGHFGGSTDAVLLGVPDLPPGMYSLGEFKTHNEERFFDLQNKGVRDAVWEHYVQLQIYLRDFRMEWGVYLAVNKDNDRIHAELIPYDAATAEFYGDQRAVYILTTREAPDKVNKSPGWWQCRYCSMKPVCHKGEKPAVNCRTCKHSLVLDGGWGCGFHSKWLDEAAQRAACPNHEYLEGLWNSGLSKAKP